MEKNLAAFAWGRACVAAPDAVARATRPAEPAAPELSAELRELIDGVGADGELLRLLEVRVPDLAGYAGLSYAREYADFVAAVNRRRPDLAPAVARQLHRLMAYKDEYEVARLHLDAAERAKLEAEFGEGAKVKFNLHPPLLRAIGLKRKLVLGGWFRHAFRLMRAMRGLRGTPLDPFGYAKVRRTERALIAEYRAMVEAALDRPDALEICELPEMIRGYEDIKLRSVERFRGRAAELAG